MQSKNLQEHTIKVVKFHKNIAEDLTTVDRKRKESPLDEDVEQEYDAKTTSAEVRYLALYHRLYSCN